jgi:hypothetical protein
MFLPYSLRPLVPILKKTLRPFFRVLPRQSFLATKSDSNRNLARTLRQKTQIRRPTKRVLSQPPIAIHHFVGAALSLGIPGLGHVFQGHFGDALRAFVIGIQIALLTYALLAWKVSGFFIGIVVLLCLPWWLRQATDVYLSMAGNPSKEKGLLAALRIGRERGEDLRIIGAIILAVTLGVTLPESLSVFLCSKILATVQQLFFLVLGYGLLTLRRWSLFIYVGIAVLQIFNISAYSECYDKAIPPALMALVMVLSCAYVFARRDRFSVQPTPVKPYTPVTR